MRAALERHALVDVVRAVDHGFRSVLIGDVGFLRRFGRIRAAGDLPASMQAKISVMLPLHPATAELPVELGASTLNLAPDLAVALTRQRVRRARLGLDIRLREAPAAVRSEAAAHGRGIPVPAR
jgi:hypothetical protein